MLSSQTNNRIHTSGLSAVDKMAVRTAIAALDILKQAASDLDCPIEALDDEKLIRWIRTAKG